MKTYLVFQWFLLEARTPPRNEFRRLRISCFQIKMSNSVANNSEAKVNFTWIFFLLMYYIYFCYVFGYSIFLKDTQTNLLCSTLFSLFICLYFFKKDIVNFYYFCFGHLFLTNKYKTKTNHHQIKHNCRLLRFKYVPISAFSVSQKL